MTLSPSANPFFSCISSSKLSKRNHFLCKAKDRFSHFDFNLFCKILSEWESSPTLHSCFSHWQKFVRVCDEPNSLSFHVLSFNVRGLDHRWQEVLLLISSFKFDALVLLETGVIDISFYEKIFYNFKIFYQKGENRNGGILVLVKERISVSRVCCKLPNVSLLMLKEKSNLGYLVYMHRLVNRGRGTTFPRFYLRNVLFMVISMLILCKMDRKLTYYWNGLMINYCRKLYQTLQLRYAHPE